MTAADARHQSIAAIRARYTQRIRERLRRPQLDIEEARDGMLDCYVASYFGGLERGRSGYFGIDVNETQVSRVALALFRSRMRAHGTDFESPTVEILDRVRSEVDAELHFQDLPADLRELHEQLCGQLLSKADDVVHEMRSGVISRRSARAYIHQASMEEEVTTGLRESLAKYLSSTGEKARKGATLEELRACQVKIDRLIETLAEFS